MHFGMCMVTSSESRKLAQRTEQCGLASVLPRR